MNRAAGRSERHDSSMKFTSPMATFSADTASPPLPSRTPGVHELQVDTLRESREQRRPVAGQPGMDHELVLIDQSQLRQRQRQRHAACEQSLARLLLQLLNGLPQIPTHELRVPIDAI